MYARFFKRLIDFTLSLIALLVLSPLLMVLIILGFFLYEWKPIFYARASRKK